MSRHSRQITFLFDKFDSERQNLSLLPINLHFPSRWIRGKMCHKFYILEIRSKICGSINPFIFKFLYYDITEPGVGIGTDYGL
jgi:hypothetical protein